MPKSAPLPRLALLVAGVLAGCEAAVPTDPATLPVVAPASSTVAASAPLDRIAFQSNRAGTGYHDIWVVNEDGSGLTRLTSTLAHEQEPAFSYDGTRIAFASDVDGDFDIYVMNADGTGVVQLTDDPARDGFPSFSPDGSTLVFESDRDGDPDIYLMDAATGAGVTRVTGSTSDTFRDHHPEYSKDGTRLTFFRGGPFHNYAVVMELATGDVARVTVDDLQANGFPTLSPDGTRVAVQAFLGSQPYMSDVWTVHATEPPAGDILNGRVNLTGLPDTDDGHPSYDLDEPRIAFASARDVTPNSFGANIFLMNDDGSGVVKLTSGDAIDTNPSFGPPAGPVTADDCKKGGWASYGFRNQGQCIRYVNTGKDSR